MEDEEGFSEIPDVLDELETTVQPKRTILLSVLCILTWVGSGATLLIMAYAFLLGQQSIVKMRSNSMNFWFLLEVLPPLVCSAGALIMWFLNRAGFIVYLAGQLPPIIFAFYSAMAVEGLRGASLVFVIVFNIIPIGFMVLYTTCLVTMKPLFAKAPRSV